MIAPEIGSEETQQAGYFEYDKETRKSGPPLYINERLLSRVYGTAGTLPTERPAVPRRPAIIPYGVTRAWSH